MKNRNISVKNRKIIEYFLNSPPADDNKDITPLLPTLGNINLSHDFADRILSQINKPLNKPAEERINYDNFDYFSEQDTAYTFFKGYFLKLAAGAAFIIILCISINIFTSRDVSVYSALALPELSLDTFSESAINSITEVIQ